MLIIPRAHTVPTHHDVATEVRMAARLALLPVLLHQWAATVSASTSGPQPPVGRTGGIEVAERGGGRFSSAPLIRRMGFQRSNRSRDDPCGPSSRGRSGVIQTPLSTFHS